MINPRKHTISMILQSFVDSLSVRDYTQFNIPRLFRKPLTAISVTHEFPIGGDTAYGAFVLSNGTVFHKQQLIEEFENFYIGCKIKLYFEQVKKFKNDVSTNVMVIKMTSIPKN